MPTRRDGDPADAPFGCIRAGEANTVEKGNVGACLGDTLTRKTEGAAGTCSVGTANGLLSCTFGEPPLTIGGMGGGLAGAAGGPTGADILMSSNCIEGHSTCTGEAA